MPKMSLEKHSQPITEKKLLKGKAALYAPLSLCVIEAQAI